MLLSSLRHTDASHITLRFSLCYFAAAAVFMLSLRCLRALPLRYAYDFDALPSFAAVLR